MESETQRQADEVVHVYAESELGVYLFVVECCMENPEEYTLSEKLDILQKINSWVHWFLGADPDLEADMSEFSYGLAWDDEIKDVVIVKENKDDGEDSVK